MLWMACLFLVCILAQVGCLALMLLRALAQLLVWLATALLHLLDRSSHANV